MKFEARNSDIVVALSRIKSVVAQRATLDILKCVAIRLSSNGTLTVEATNLDQHMSSESVGKVTAMEPGNCAVDHAKLLGYLSANQLYDTIRFETTEGCLRITSDNWRSECSLAARPLEDFPTAPKPISSTPIVLPARQFVSLLRFVRPCMSQDETRFVLNGAFLKADGDRLIVVATDGRRLSGAEATIRSPIKGDGILAPYDAVVAVCDAAGWMDLDVGDDCEIRASDAPRAEFRFNGCTLYTKQVDGTYPKYSQVVPVDDATDCVVEVPADLLRVALSHIAPIANPKNDAVVLSVAGIELSIAYKQEDDSECKHVLTVGRSGAKKASIALNHAYLMQAVESFLGATMTIRIKDELSPIKVTSGNLLHVLMPMRIV